MSDDGPYVFDPDAADRPCRFVERFCRHYEGRHAGKPFTLHPAQREIVRDVYGWRVRATGFRRYTDVYFEAAVGAGKSPLLAALGLYGLTADGEPAAEVYSLASTYGQARIVFETAKRFIANNPELERRLVVTQFEIRHPRSGSFWRIVSGKGPGAGCRPSLILADEVHEWPTAAGYSALRDRMAKRSQPLLWAATNAGDSRASFCWQLRDRALAALAGDGDPSLYPAIWGVTDDEGADAVRTDDPAAWRQANPLLGVTIDAGKVAAMSSEALKDPDAERQFRRLYLGVWPRSGGGRWLDLALWDEAVARADGRPPEPADSPLYVGLDLAQSDDLCAAVYVRPTGDGLFRVRSEFWVPRATAERYEQADAIPFAAWAAAGFVHLTDEPTVGPAVRRRIAEAVLVEARRPELVRAVCYDRYKADDAVATLEAAGVPCVPVPQGWSVSSGCHELDRRLKEGSAAIERNDVLRWCAENTEVTQDARGNIWPVKPNARGRYAGTRGKKIDGISALVTALTEARKHAFPAAAAGEWRGTVCSM